MRCLVRGGMTLHPIFQTIVDAHFASRPGEYRGWQISFDYPPIPCRDFDWSATHPDYDGAEDANDNHVVHGRTRRMVLDEIDRWHEENVT